MIRALLFLMMLATSATAQQFTALARLDPAASAVSRTEDGTRIDLALSQPVRWRVFTLDEPRRLVLDFWEVDWRGADPAALLRSDQVSELRFGAMVPGWSRMVVDLAEPLKVAQAGMQQDQGTGAAQLSITLVSTDAQSFAEAVKPPARSGWDALARADTTRPAPERADDGVLVVTIDPGHGGVDPGASRDGIREADLMLELAQDVARAIARTDGMRAVLTREADVFVPLQERMSIARAAGADVFVSLHADALEIGHAAGASIYVLDAVNHDEATERMAQRHGRADLLAGLDLSDQDDTVAMVLMDLARSKTAPASLRLSDALIASLARTGARLNSNPARAGKLAVLMSADFPSVLIEAGFLSNDADRAALQTPEGRAPLVAGIVLGLRSWAGAEAAR